MNIDIDTRFIHLIGKPLRQSFAARMQNAAYEAMGVNLIYHYEEADDSHLEQIVSGLRYMPSVLGFAVTKPNKVKVLEYLDELDPLCEKMGACNTVMKLEDGRLRGYNTDGMGFYLSIKEETDIDLSGKTCFCFGAGGAGRAICSSLAHSGVKKICITDAVERSAYELMDDINTNFGAVAELVKFGDCAQVPESEIVINATGVGMGKSEGKSPMPASCVREGQFYFDACYNPEKTRFLLDAEERGCRILNGLGMSLYQGAAQIEIWTGQKAPVEIMREELRKITEEHKLGSIPVIEGARK